MPLGKLHRPGRGPASHQGAPDAGLAGAGKCAWGMYHSTSSVVMHLTSHLQRLIDDGLDWACTASTGLK